MRILLDTSILIDDLRQSHLPVQTIFQSIYKSKERLYLSSISIGELYSGSSAESMEREIEEIISLTDIVQITVPLIRSAGINRRTTHISLIDAIISATALELDLPIATLNVKDFEKVNELKICSLDEIDRRH